MARKTGFSSNTIKRVAFDTAVIIRNFIDPTLTTPPIGITPVKLGASRGGVTFSLETEYRDMEVDGMTASFIGSKRPVGTVASLSTNLLEIDKDLLTLYIPGSTYGESFAAIDELGRLVDGEVMHKIERAMRELIPEFEYSNLAAAVRYGKNKSPAIFEVKNAMASSSFNIELTDKNELAVSTTFTGQVSPDDIDAEPWSIYIPEAIGITGTSVQIPGIDEAMVKISGSEADEDTLKNIVEVIGA
jgi:hypothetical protein